MVTCPNQLINSKHLQRFPEPSKWSLSLVHWATQSWGRLLIWQLFRRQSLTPLQIQSAVSKHVNRKLSGRKKCGRKRCTTSRENRSLMRIVKQNWFKNLGELHKEWTEAGSRHQEPPHTDVSRNLATVFVRGVLTGLRRRRTGLLPSGPKSSFQMRASFIFHLETKVLESGGRVEKLIAQVSWSPVLSFHSLRWFGVQCHLLVLVHCVTAPV